MPWWRRASSTRAIAEDRVSQWPSSQRRLSATVFQSSLTSRINCEAAPSVCSTPVANEIASPFRRKFVDVAGVEGGGAAGGAGAPGFHVADELGPCASAIKRTREMVVLAPGRGRRGGGGGRGGAAPAGGAAAG